MIYPQYLTDRFWKKVDKNFQCECHSWEERCWVWIGGKYIKGYGAFVITPELMSDNKRWCRNAHAVALEIKMNDFIISPLQANHTLDCKLKSCVRHVYLGTSQDNMLDALKLGKQMPKGEQHHQKKLNNEQVILMTQYWLTGEYTQKALGEFFSVCQAVVSCTVRGLSWKHLKE